MPSARAEPGGTATAAIGPPGHLVALSGQLGVRWSGGPQIPSSLDEQIRWAFANLAAGLERAGLAWPSILKFTTYLVGRETLPTFHAVRDDVLGPAFPDGVLPPNTTILVAGLFHERARIEIDALAMRIDGDR